MLNVVSAALTVTWCLRGLTIPEVAQLAKVTPDDVFDAENFLGDAPFDSVMRIANTLGVDLDAIQQKFDSEQ